jgi:hypothetical protein
VRRTLEVIFRHPLQLLTLIVLLPIVGVAVPYFTVPHTYQSTASVWALQRYFVIGATGPESDLTATPAQTQTIALTELLQTNNFVLSVVKGIDLAPTLGLSDSVMNDPQQLQEAFFNEISKRVAVTSSAYNLFSISYTNPNPRIAQQIVESVITNFGRQSLGLSVAEGQNLLGTYQVQLATAQKDLDNAIAAETQYNLAHPGLPSDKLISDPQLAVLDAQRVQAQATEQIIQNIINTIHQSINTQGLDSNTLFQVIDAPQLPDRPASRTKDYLVGGGVGLAVALLACVMYLVIAVRRDRGIYSPKELQDLVAFPVIMQLPNLTPETASLLTTNTMRGQALLTEGKSSTTNTMRGQALLTEGKSSANGHIAR